MSISLALRVAFALLDQQLDAGAGRAAHGVTHRRFGDLENLGVAGLEFGGDGFVFSAMATSNSVLDLEVQKRRPRFCIKVSISSS